MCQIIAPPTSYSLVISCPFSQVNLLYRCTLFAILFILSVALSAMTLVFECLICSMIVMLRHKLWLPYCLLFSKYRLKCILSITVYLFFFYQIKFFFYSSGSYPFDIPFAKHFSGLILNSENGKLFAVQSTTVVNTRHCYLFCHIDHVCKYIIHDVYHMHRWTWHRWL